MIEISRGQCVLLLLAVIALLRWALLIWRRAQRRRDARGGAQRVQENEFPNTHLR
jgi:hypothetical protein